MFAWLEKSFGGQRAKLAGKLDAVKYGNLWILAQKADMPPTPSLGNAIDHLGWATANLDGTAVDLKGKSVKFSMEPRAVGTLKVSFVDGPEGLRVEVLQR